MTGNSKLNSGLMISLYFSSIVLTFLLFLILNKNFNDRIKNFSKVIDVKHDNTHDNTHNT